MNDGQQFKIEDVVARYIGLRDEKDKIEADAKARVEKLAEQMRIIEGWLHQQMQTLGVESFKTEYGTAFVKMTDFCGVQDWNLTLQYIQENQAWNLLNKAVNKTAVKEFIAENQVPPPGVNYGMKQEVQVRRGK
jgi:hypothetical protein